MSIAGVLPSAGRATWAWASTVLQRRWHGMATDAPDWLCAEAVQSIEQALRPGEPLWVAVREGVTARSLPAHLTLPGGHGRWPLRYHRAVPARAQAEAPALTLKRGQQLGTATALLRDKLAPARHYLLTCAHVVAPNSAARAGDAVQVELAGAAWTGRLREWQPALGIGCPPSALDAALVELDGGVLQRLLERLQAPGDPWLPVGLDDEVHAERPVAMQRCGKLGGMPVAGHLASFWSGEVLVGDDDYPDYFLREAVGYRTDSATQPGDSGAAIWVQGDKLLGMHVAGLDAGSSRFGANAVLARVQPALEWFNAKPYTRFDPATVTAEDWPRSPKDVAQSLHPPPEDLGQDDKRDLLVLTQTLWAEARGETDEGMEAVAAVILNRHAAHWRGARTVADVCLAPLQFSCWNAGDPNRAAIARVTAAPDKDFRRAGVVARRALGLQAPPTLTLPADVRHYHAVSMTQLPVWARGRPPLRQIGRHVFYAGVA